MGLPESHIVMLYEHSDTLLAATAIEAQLYLVTRNTKDVVATGA